jgi:hypothetical protein
VSLASFSTVYAQICAQTVEIVKINNLRRI